MSAPRFSIIMAAFNAATTIDPAIRSALAQTIHDLEVIVVDDGSADDTRDRAEALAGGDGRVRVFSQLNGGPSNARNRATAEARGDLLAFLDADDLLLPDYLERMGHALDAVPRAGLATTDAWVLDDATGRVRRAGAMVNQRPPERPPDDAGELLRMLLERNFVFFPTVRRRALEDAGPWRESLTAAEDYELWLRVVARGYGAAFVPGRPAVHRELAGSNSADLPRQLRSMREVYRLVVDDWDVDDRTRAVALRRRGELDRLVRRFDPDTRDVRERLTRPLRRARNRLRERTRWHDVPPPEVAGLLAAASVRPAP